VQERITRCQGVGAFATAGRRSQPLRPTRRMAVPATGSDRRVRRTWLWSGATPESGAREKPSHSELSVPCRHGCGHHSDTGRTDRWRSGVGLVREQRRLPGECQDRDPGVSFKPATRWLASNARGSARLWRPTALSPPSRWRRSGGRRDRAPKSPRVLLRPPFETAVRRP